MTINMQIETQQKAQKKEIPKTEEQKEKQSDSPNKNLNSCAVEQDDATWYLYIVQTKHSHFYTGISIDWVRRLKEHSSSGPKCAKALKGKGPIVLRYCCKLPNQRTAMQAEIWLKKQTKRNKLAIVNGHKALPYEHSLVPF